MTAPILIRDARRLDARHDPERLTNDIAEVLKEGGFGIRRVQRHPWGAAICVRGRDDRSLRFFRHFYQDVPEPVSPLAPTILLIRNTCDVLRQPRDMRGGILRVVHGHLGIRLPPDDARRPLLVHEPGDSLHVPAGMRYRLAGLSGWAVVAEISCEDPPATNASS